MGDETSDAYAAASKRWPMIGWPRDAYAAHVNGEAAAHACDLYVAGAAGHRVDAAWGAIETDLAPDVQRILKKQPTADYTVDDLWGDTRFKLMDADADAAALPDGRQPAKLIRYRGKVALVNYMVLIGRRLAISRKRRVKPTLALVGGGDDAEPRGYEPADTANAAPHAEAAEREAAANLGLRLSAAMSGLSAEQRFLIRMVYDRGMMQKDAGELLGFSPFKTSRQLKEAVARLAEALDGVASADASPALMAAWEGAWAEQWSASDVQVGSGSASEQARREGT